MEGDGRHEGEGSEEGEAREAIRGAEGEEGPLDEQGPDRRLDRAYEWREEGLLHEGPQGARGDRAQALGEGDRDPPEHRPLEDAHEKGDEGRQEDDVWRRDEGEGQAGEESGQGISCQGAEGCQVVDSDALA